MMETATTHARFAPSAASRWLACPASVGLSTGIKDQGSVAAMEGTAAHAIAEKCLRAGEPSAAKYAGQWVTASGKVTTTKPGHAFYDMAFPVDLEMVAGVDCYLRTVEEWTANLMVHSVPPALFIEERVTYNEAMYGTSDCILLSANDEHLAIVDLKYGKGAVAAWPNPQLIIYALAAMRTVCTRDALPSRVSMVIVQPRGARPVVRFKTADIEELLPVWPDRIDAAISSALSDEPIIAAGEQCRWCPAVGVCPIGGKP